MKKVGVLSEGIIAILCNVILKIKNKSVEISCPCHHVFKIIIIIIAIQFESSLMEFSYFLFFLGTN